MSERKDCLRRNCKFFNVSYEGNCAVDRCIYKDKGNPKEGKIRENVLTNLIDELTDEELLSFSNEMSFSSINEEEPVSVREFILSPDYLDLGVQGTIWEENIKIVEDIYSGKYNEAYVIGGIGMGKSTLSSIVALYAVYRILILKNPHSVYRMVANSPIEVVILSINEMLAKDVIFTYAMNLCNNSQFFRRKEYAPNPDIKSRLQFPKNVSIVPLSGAKTAGISRNVILGIMDEASWYPVVASGDRASLQYSNLTRRIKSRFEKADLPPGVLKGLIVAVSSPCSEEDFMEKTLRDKGGRPNIYSRRMTSFEAKDVVDKDGKRTFSNKSFWFCSTCRKVVEEHHYRKEHDILIKNKHEGNK